MGGGESYSACGKCLLHRAALVGHSELNRQKGALRFYVFIFP